MIKLVREDVTASDALNNRHQWPVKYTATYTSNEEPARIFVMQVSPDDGLFTDSLSCVASATQMSDLPADEPGPGSPFYRVASVTKLCRSAKAAEEFIKKLEWAVQDLVDNLHAAENLTQTTEIIFTPTAS